MQAIQTPIAGLPLILRAFLHSNTVMILPALDYSAIFEQGFQVNADIFPDEIVLKKPSTGEVMEIPTHTQIEYKSKPLLIEWLKQQGLGLPTMKFS